MGLTTFLRLIAAEWFGVYCRVFCGTWNVNGQPATWDIQPWLSAPYDDIPPDIYAVGFVLQSSYCPH